MMMPLPLFLSNYNLLVTEEFVSISLLYWSHMATAGIGIVFAWFIWQQTKKLSAFYLLLATVAFGGYSYLDLLTWAGYSNSIMFSWSILEILYVSCVVFVYWFFFAFVHKKDVPVIHKVVSLSTLAVPILLTLNSLNIDTYFAPEIIAFENDYFINYSYVLVPLLCMITIIISTISLLPTYTDPKQKSKLIWGTSGILVFLLFLMSFQVVSNLLLFIDSAANLAYSYTVYAFFCMPFLIGFLGYLVAKYQAFDLKLTRSIGYILLLMLLLFVSIFI
jgi:hypothetical protein